MHSDHGFNHKGEEQRVGEQADASGENDGSWNDLGAQRVRPGVSEECQVPNALGEPQQSGAEDDGHVLLHAANAFRNLSQDSTQRELFRPDISVSVSGWHIAPSESTAADSDASPVQHGSER